MKEEESYNLEQKNAGTVSLIPVEKIQSALSAGVTPWTSHYQKTRVLVPLLKCFF
jgi:hypothetical protein